MKEKLWKHLKDNNNTYIDQFLDRCNSFPRESITMIEPNVIRVITNKTHEGYAWIGASEHNKDNGCRGVDFYNYMLIEARELDIHFKDAEGERQ